MCSQVDLSALPDGSKYAELDKLCKPENDYRPEVYFEGRKFTFSVILSTFDFSKIKTVKVKTLSVKRDGERLELEFQEIGSGKVRTHVDYHPDEASAAKTEELILRSIASRNVCTTGPIDRS